MNGDAVLILGASGMLGYSLFTNLSENSQFLVYGTLRNLDNKSDYFDKYKGNIFNKIDVINNLDALDLIFKELNPKFVINCIGLIKQNSIANQYIDSININSLFPHKLAALCDKFSAKLIHFSTDCIFSGKLGNYSEYDTPDAIDLYGRTKLLGEVQYGNHVTLRTSIIGHELISSISLIDWFLSQSNPVSGYSRAIFTGFPTAYIAQILMDKVLLNDKLSGLYHLSSNPIDKCTLLKLVAKFYNKNIVINPNSDFVIDRSLNSEKFRTNTRFIPDNWEYLVEFMYKDYVKRYVK